MKNVLEFLEETERKYPERIAVEDETICFKWCELKSFSQRIGSFLCKVSEAKKPIAIVAEKGTFTLTAMLGTVYAGCFYVIVDPALPVGRVHEIVQILEPEAVIILKEQNEDMVRNAGYNGKIIILNKILATEINQSDLKERREKSCETDLLYGIFTSGSTGKPKGVVVSHKAVIDFISKFAHIFNISSEDRIGNQAPFDFDVSVKDIYTSLTTGARLVIIPKTLFSLPPLLLDYICERKVTILIWAVSALEMIAALKGLEYRVPDQVKKIFFSGEVMSVKLLKKWQTALPYAEFVNLYGPTEITCNCTYYPIRKIFNEDEKIPVGKPFSGRIVFLIDENGERITSPEIKGEICVSGESLATGYYHNQEETDKRFRMWSYNGVTARCYFTGDLGYYGTDGLLYFSGRKDFQIKHMGHRIELEEIESAVEQVENVEKCCCIIDYRKNKLTAFYLGTAEKKLIKKHLKENLPPYMIPHAILKTDKIPLNKNGKTDRNYFIHKLEAGT